MYWLELFNMALPSKNAQIKKLHTEAKELLAITVASIKTSRKNSK